MAEKGELVAHRHSQFTWAETVQCCVVGDAVISEYKTDVTPDDLIRAVSEASFQVHSAFLSASMSC